MESQSSTGRRPTGSDNSRPSFAAIESLEVRLLMRHSVWGLDNHLVNQDAALSAYPTVNGSGESIAVIDTGIDYNNPVLGGGTGKHFKVRTGWNFISNNANYLDTDGHGTAVAGVLAANPFKYHDKIYQGVAPQAQLIALKVDDGVHNPPASRIRAALQWVLNNQTKYNIVSVNISEGDNNDYTNKTTTNQYSDLLAQCAARGIFVAAAAGNDGWSNGVEYPAADPNVAAVSSVDFNDNVSNFSDTGPSLNLFAPGQDVVAPTLSGGREVFAYLAGTSFSAPWVAGAAALIKQLNPRFSTAQILDTMESTGHFDTDPTNAESFSRLDLLAALNSTDKAVRRARAAGQ
jgi:type VI secretion system secreted protein VgrG